MLRTNLSTHPFYNVRAVQIALGLLAAVVVGVSAFNIIEIVRLSAAQQTLGAKAAAAETEASQLRGTAAAIRAQINPSELNTVAIQARDVRITSVQPLLDSDGTFSVQMSVQARRVEDLDAFIEALETKSTFRDVLATQEQVNEDSIVEALVEGVYVTAPGAATPAGGTR